MEIICPNCGVENWLENQSKCISCESILRRCIDCNGYEPRQRLCRRLNIEVEPDEARAPRLLSSSTTCWEYRPRAERVAAHQVGPG